MNENGIQEEDRELIKNIEIDRDPMSGGIKLAPILNRLADMCLPVKDTIVSYKSHIENTFVFVGKEPIDEDVTINFNDLEPHNNRLILRCRQNGQTQAPAY